MIVIINCILICDLCMKSMFKVYQCFTDTLHALHVVRIYIRSSTVISVNGRENETSVSIRRRGNITLNLPFFLKEGQGM